MQIKIILHRSGQSRLREQVTTHAVEDMRKGIIYLFIFAGGSANFYSHYGYQCGSSTGTWVEIYFKIQL